VDPGIGSAGGVDRNSPATQLFQDCFELALNRAPGLLALPTYKAASIEVKDGQKGSAHGAKIVGFEVGLKGGRQGGKAARRQD
jgi:hypothetical protein